MEPVIWGLLCQEGKAWVQPDRAELNSNIDLNGSNLSFFPPLSCYPSDKQQGLWECDRASAGVQRFRAGAAAHPGEPARTEASQRTQHQESHPLPQDCPH